MKRILSLLLALLLLLSLSSCGVSGDRAQMEVPTQTVGESTEPLFWPPLPVETEETGETEETLPPATTEETKPATGQQRPSGNYAGGNSSGDIEATYIPREDEEQTPPRAEQGEEPVESTPDDDVPVEYPPVQPQQPEGNQQPTQPQQPDVNEQPDQSDQPEQTEPPVQTQPTQAPETQPETTTKLDPNGHYNARDDIALYIHLYGKLPGNFYTKRQAESKFGWVDGRGDPLSKYAPGMSIGGDRFYNKEKVLPPGTYYECDIDTVGAKSRGSKRIVFCKDGTVYYTSNHYKSFVKLYGPR